MSNLETAVQLKAELDALRPLTVDQEQRIWQKFRFDWNYHSNNIEGNSLTFGETKSLLLHNITAQGKPLKDHIEITGHNEAINALLDLTRGDTPLTESFFRSLHTLILRERYRVDAQTTDGKPTKKWVEVGQYKTAANHVLTVTGETFRFAEPIDVPDKMQRLLLTVNGLQGRSDAEILVAAAKIHYDFVLIHPFDDGNGRMARLLMNLVLIKFGLPPAIIRTEDKANYFAALRQADGGQLDAFIEYIALCVCVSLKTMLAGARGESLDEPDEQDRQIKMLARMIEGRVGKITLSRSKAALLNCFDESFVPMAQDLVAAAAKFAVMYATVNISVYVEGAHTLAKQSLDEQLASGRQGILEETSYFVLNIEFQNLVFEGFDHVRHLWQLNAQTNPSTYSVTFDGAASAINKSYGHQITPTEREMIVKRLTDEHIRKVKTETGVNFD